jgi:hypothetical protein
MDESWQAIVDAQEDYQTLIDKLVAEGRRVGKVPWCADGYAHGEAAMRLDFYDITEWETMEETKARRVTEEMNA